MKKWRKSMPLLLMIWPYLFFLVCLLPNGLDKEVYTGFILGYVVLTAIVYILNIWNAFAPLEGRSAQKLAFYDMLIKLVHIPFYLGVFFVSVILVVIMVVPALSLLSPFMIMLLFFVDLCLMLTSSMYGISAFVLALAEGRVSKGKLFLYGALHFSFVTDVIGAVLLYAALKKHSVKPMS